MKRYAIPALIATLLFGCIVSRVVWRCLEYKPAEAHQRDLAIQAKAPYDDVEMTNAGWQLVWFQQIKGERPVYIPPPFVRTW